MSNPINMITKEQIQQSMLNGTYVGEVCVNNSEYIILLSDILRDKDYINSLLQRKIDITEEQIREHLKSLPKEKKENNFRDIQIKNIDKQYICEEAAISLLNNYKKYIEFIKKRITCLLEVLEHSTNPLAGKMLEKLDINLEYAGKLSLYDYLRLIEPLIYNIKELEEILDEANYIGTYSIRRNVLRKNAFINEIFEFKILDESNGLQLYNDILFEQYGDKIYLFVPLTPNQRKKRIEENAEYMKSLSKKVKKPGSLPPVIRSIIEDN